MGSHIERYSTQTGYPMYNQFPLLPQAHYIPADGCLHTSSGCSVSPLFATTTIGGIACLGQSSTALPSLQVADILASRPPWPINSFWIDLVRGFLLYSSKRENHLELVPIEQEHSWKQRILRKRYHRDRLTVGIERPPPLTPSPAAIPRVCHRQPILANSVRTSWGSERISP